MAQISPIDRNELPEFEDRFAFIERAMGFVPNSMFTMARVPGLLEGFSDLGAVVLGNGLIPPDLVHMVSFMASAGAGCRYCQAHTAHSAERSGVPDHKLTDLWSFESSDHFTDAERAALRLAFHAGHVPNAVTPADFAACREHYTDEQITAIVAVCAFFGYLNRWNDTMATDLEDGPAAFGERVLGPGGWEAGKHAP